MQTGMIFDIMKYSIQDGPGIRTTVFFKGCPLNCWWCHNPESQKAERELIIRKEKCIGCGDCVEACGSKAIIQAETNRENCTLCGQCTEVCFSETRQMTGRKVSAAEVMKEIEKDKIFYEESRGGVTFSGGEPFMQLKFLDNLLQCCQDKAIHTAVDTTGYVNLAALLDISKKVDLFLYDVKIMDDKKHKYYTGVSNKLILKNLAKLAKVHQNITVRIPVIPGINDDYENIAKTGKYLADLTNIRHVSILPYHQAGVEKYHRMNKEYRLGQIVAPPAEKMEEIEEQLNKFGLIIKIGG